MPHIKTEITEIVTGLGMLEYPSFAKALSSRAPEMFNMGQENWQRLDEAHESGKYENEIESAWDNGRFFLYAKDGLRGRSPLKIEWKGPQNPPGYDFLPADLRVDHVYLISCKYLSKVLANLSPPHLFQRLMAERGQRDSIDWYLKIAPEAYQNFYQKVREDLQKKTDLPADIRQLSISDRKILKSSYERTWPDHLQIEYNQFAVQVGKNSAELWQKLTPEVVGQELLLWRMLRLNSSSYFILGSSRNSSLRLRVGTPWDWRQNYMLKEFDVSYSTNSSPQTPIQPMVSWRATIEEKKSRFLHEIKGHVEIRWSHGRFCGNPEAKLYLDSEHSKVPGYYPIM